MTTKRTRWIPRSPRRMAVPLLVWVLALASCQFLSGCRMAYLFQVASGQFRLLNSAVPVEEALKGDTLNDTQKANLGLVEKIKEFAESDLGLKRTSSYETINLETNHLAIYVVSACPKDRLHPVTWWFPIVGSLPYLGFFDLESARAEGKKLLEKDLDVIVGKAEAYSTLGWFRDPLTMNLVGGSTLDLVETVLHEMTHSTLYVKGQGEFNENLAMLMGKVGARLFMEKTFGPSHPLTQEAMKSIEDERLFSPFLNSLMTELKSLYHSSLSYEDKLVQREKAFASSRDRFRLLKSRLQTPRFLHFEEAHLNNAFLISLAIYHGRYLLFDQTLQRCGNSVKEMLQLLRTMSKEEGNMLVMMQEWLDAHQAQAISGSGARQNHHPRFLEVPADAPGSPASLRQGIRTRMNNT